MQGNISRFLQPVFELAELNRNQQLAPQLAKLKGAQVDTSTSKTSEKKEIKLPNEFSGQEFLAFLLHVNAEIEHGLMVQYLYAAYSIGGEQIPEEYRDQARKWQEVILGIAKEEMGHFISCQNVLKLIGAPLNLGRNDYPWDTPFYPFPFALEALSLDSLAKYVYAESPKGWVDSDNEIAREIKERMALATNDPHRVGALFEKMIELIDSRELLPDDVFQDKTYPYQAKFDEWGRGYTGGERGNSSHGSPKGSPDVLVMPLLSRDDAKKALLAISEQGEDTGIDPGTSMPSHFERFLSVYTEIREVLAKDPANSWSPSRNVASNPFLGYHEEVRVTAKSKGMLLAAERVQVEITHPLSVRWAELFNLRYRMLLNYLSHSFQIDDAEAHGIKTARGAIIGATFGEMYNLRSISNVLVRLPVALDSEVMAGPPFMIPYTLNLPAGEYNKWRLHADLVTTSIRIANQIIAMNATENRVYLNGLIEADQKFLAQLNEIISHLKL